MTTSNSIKVKADTGVNRLLRSVRETTADAGNARLAPGIDTRREAMLLIPTVAITE